MRYSILFPAFAAVAVAQVSSITYPSGYVNPFTAYLTETDSRGVVTGHPPVNTDVATSQPANTAVAVTTQPSVITSQQAAATSPAGTPSSQTTLVPIATGTGTGTGSSNGTTGSNSTVSSASLKSSASSGASSVASSTGSAAGSSTGTATTGSSSSTSSSSSKSGAGMLEPVLGLGFAGALFAAFL